MNKRQRRKAINLASIKRIEGWLKIEALEYGIRYRKRSPSQRLKDPLRSFCFIPCFTGSWVNESLLTPKHIGRFPCAVAVMSELDAQDDLKTKE